MFYYYWLVDTDRFSFKLNSYALVGGVLSIYRLLDLLIRRNTSFFLNLIHLASPRSTSPSLPLDLSRNNQYYILKQFESLQIISTMLLLQLSEASKMKRPRRETVFIVKIPNRNVLCINSVYWFKNSAYYLATDCRAANVIEEYTTENEIFCFLTSRDFAVKL